MTETCRSTGVALESWSNDRLLFMATAGPDPLLPFKLLESRRYRDKNIFIRLGCLEILMHALISNTKNNALATNAHARSCEKIGS